MTRFLFATVLAGAIACGGAAAEPGSTTGFISANSCVKAHEKILADVATIAAAHAQGCQTDADCALADVSIACQENCAAGVRVDQEDALQSALTDYAVQICPGTPSGCYVESTCAAHPGAACVAGACRPVPAG